MLPSFAKLRIGGATAARTPARVGAPIPCDALDAKEGEDEDEITKRAWAYIAAHPELEDMVTLDSLAGGYEIDDHWKKHLWYGAPDGDEKIVVDLPDGWDKGPTAIIRVSPFCTDANGRKSAEYVLKGTLLASFAHQRYDPIDDRERRPFPEAYKVPGGTGRDSLVPEVGDPNYGEMLGILERFLDECQAIVVNPKMDAEDQRRLYDRSKDEVVRVYAADRWQTGQPSNPFPSWKPDHGEDSGSEAEQGYATGRLIGEAFVKAMEDLDVALFPTYALKARALDAADNVVRAWNRDTQRSVGVGVADSDNAEDEGPTFRSAYALESDSEDFDGVREYLAIHQRSRFFRAIGQTGLYELFMDAEDEFLAQQARIMSFWYTITDRSPEILEHLKSQFEVGVGSPIETWFRFEPDDSLDEESDIHLFDGGNTLRKRALTFVSDMLWKNQRPRPRGGGVGFTPNEREVTDEERIMLDAMDTRIDEIEEVVRRLERTLKTPQGVLQKPEIDRLTLKLDGLGGYFKGTPFEDALDKQGQALRLFKAGLQAHVAVYAASDSLSTPSFAQRMLAKFYSTMLAVVEAVDLDRDGALPEPANQYTMTRFFWEFVVPLREVWTAYAGKRRTIESTLDSLIEVLPDRPHALSLPPAAPAPPPPQTRDDSDDSSDDESDSLGPVRAGQPRAELIDGVMRAGQFFDGVRRLTEQELNRYATFKARVATTAQWLVTLRARLDLGRLPLDANELDAFNIRSNVEMISLDLAEMAFPSTVTFLATAVSLANAAHDFAHIVTTHHYPPLRSTNAEWLAILEAIVQLSKNRSVTSSLTGSAFVNQSTFKWFLDTVMRPVVSHYPRGDSLIVNLLETYWLPQFAPPGSGFPEASRESSESQSGSEPPTPQALIRARSSGEATPGRRRQRTGAAI